MTTHTSGSSVTSGLESNSDIDLANEDIQEF